MLIYKNVQDTAGEKNKLWKSIDTLGANNRG